MWSMVLKLLGWLFAIVIGGSTLIAAACFVFLLYCTIEGMIAARKEMKEELNNECSGSEENREEN